MDLALVALNRQGSVLVAELFALAAMVASVLASVVDLADLGLGSYYLHTNCYHQYTELYGMRKC